jgi:hypothetical protein
VHLQSADSQEKSQAKRREDAACGVLACFWRQASAESAEIDLGEDTKKKVETNMRFPQPQSRQWVGCANLYFEELPPARVA